MSAAPDFHARFLLTVLIVALLWLLRRLLVTAVERLDPNPAHHYHLRKLSAYGATLLGFLLLGLVWFEQFRSISTFLGLLSAGLAIALKDLVLGFAGWLFILLRKPFELGDRIEIGGLRGDVIDIRLFKFTLMEVGNWVAAEQSTGRVIHVPNGQVLSGVMMNYSRGFAYLWHELPILVTFESDWRRAKEILTEIVNDKAGHLAEAAAQELKMASRRYLLHYRQLTPIVYTKIADSGVLLTLRYLSPPRGRRSLEQAICEAILDRFHESPRIDLAYPTQRFYEHVREGKPALRVPEELSPEPQSVSALDEPAGRGPTADS